MGAPRYGREQDLRLKLKQYILLGNSLERETISKKEAGGRSDAETTDVFNDRVVRVSVLTEGSRRLGIKKQ